MFQTTNQYIYIYTIKKRLLQSLPATPSPPSLGVRYHFRGVLNRGKGTKTGTSPAPPPTAWTVSTLHTPKENSSTNRIESGPSLASTNMGQYDETAKIPLTNIEKTHWRSGEMCGKNRLCMYVERPCLAMQDPEHVTCVIFAYNKSSSLSPKLPLSVP